MRCPDCGHSNPEELERCEECESFLDDSEATGIRPAPSADDSPNDSDVTGLRPTPRPDSEGADSEAATGELPAFTQFDGYALQALCRLKNFSFDDPALCDGPARLRDGCAISSPLSFPDRQSVPTARFAVSSQLTGMNRGATY